MERASIDAPANALVNVSSLISALSDLPIIMCRLKTGALRCAIGSFIEPRDYRPEWEDMVSDLAFDSELSSYLIHAGVNVHDTRTLELVEELRTVHDKYPPSDWAYELTTVATRFKLRA
jgi:hypothetical protein